jgi:hypothetical protein
MARPVLQLGGGGGGGLTPAASPTGSGVVMPYTHTDSKMRAPTIDLRGISHAANEIFDAVERSDKDAAEKKYAEIISKGEITEKQLLDKVKNGEIEEFNNEAAREWYFGMHSAKQLDRFAIDAESELDAWSGATDGEGKLLPPENFQAKLREKWAQYADDYSFTTRRGARIFNELYPKITTELEGRFLRKYRSKQFAIMKDEGIDRMGQIANVGGRADVTGTPGLSADEVRTHARANWTEMERQASKYTPDVRAMQKESMVRQLKTLEADERAEAINFFETLPIRGTPAGQIPEFQELFEKSAEGAADELEKDSRKRRLTRMTEESNDAETYTNEAIAAIGDLPREQRPEAYRKAQEQIWGADSPIPRHSRAASAELLRKQYESSIGAVDREAVFAEASQLVERGDSKAQAFISENSGVLGETARALTEKLAVRQNGTALADQGGIGRIRQMLSSELGRTPYRSVDDSILQVMAGLDEAATDEAVRLQTQGASQNPLGDMMSWVRDTGMKQVEAMRTFRQAETQRLDQKWADTLQKARTLQDISQDLESLKPNLTPAQVQHLQGISAMTANPLYMFDGKENASADDLDREVKRGLEGQIPGLPGLGAAYSEFDVLKTKKLFHEKFGEIRKEAQKLTDPALLRNTLATGAVKAIQEAVSEVASEVGKQKLNELPPDDPRVTSFMEIQPLLSRPPEEYVENYEREWALSRRDFGKHSGWIDALEGLRNSQATGLEFAAHAGQLRKSAERHSAQIIEDGSLDPETKAELLGAIWGTIGLTLEQEKSKTISVTYQAPGGYPINTFGDALLAVANPYVFAGKVRRNDPITRTHAIVVDPWTSLTQVPPSKFPEVMKMRGLPEGSLSDFTKVQKLESRALRPKAQLAEENFQKWYGGHAEKLGLDKNPDAPEHFYDYRAAFKAGAGPDESGHFPSQYKREGHPRMVVDGINTKTGERAQSQPGAGPAGPQDSGKRDEPGSRPAGKPAR